MSQKIDGLSMNRQFFISGISYAAFVQKDVREKTFPVNRDR